MKVHTHCRLCEGSCGLVADVDDNVIHGFEPDAADPVSEGFACPVPLASAATRLAADRFTRPMRRTESGLVPATWDEALRDIGERLRAIRGESGPRALALYLGDEPWQSSRALARSMAFAVGMGTPNLFTELSHGPGPRLKAAELMLGWPAPLLSDVGRAHYVVVTDSEVEEHGWGPWQHGAAHGKWVEFSRRTKKAKVVVAAPRKTGWAAEQNTFASIRPGSEPFFYLGILSATVTGGRYDFQYVRDYTTGWDRLESLVASWPVDRCAAACGLEAAELSGIALNFARAAMAVAHPGASSFTNANGAVGAWAWLALHAVTANLLRPGGLYDHEAVFDLYPAIAAASSKQAPRTRVADHPLLLLQAPATLLPDELLQEGDGRVRALVTVAGDPATRLPGSARTARALDGLDLLVCLTRQPDATTARAHWVLPITHPWEQDHLFLHEAALLPRQMTAWTPALVQPAGEARHIEDILGDLFTAARPGLRGSVWGMHLRVLGRWLATADLDKWQNKQVDWFLDETAGQSLTQAPHRFDRGDSDRSAWRVDLPGERVDLAPAPLADLVARLEAPAESKEFPLWLRTSGKVGRAPAHAPVADPGLRLHPSAGVPEGATVRLRSHYGEVEAVVHLDPTLRPDVADLPLGFATNAAALLDGARVDALTGAPALDGVGVRVDLE